MTKVVNAMRDAYRARYLQNVRGPDRNLPEAPVDAMNAAAHVLLSELMDGSGEIVCAHVQRFMEREGITS